MGLVVVVIVVVVLGTGIGVEVVVTFEPPSPFSSEFLTLTEVVTIGVVGVCVGCDVEVVCLVGIKLLFKIETFGVKNLSALIPTF